jgi:hypothetical protein
MLLAGCGHAHTRGAEHIRPSETVLSVRVASGVGPEAKDERFTLRCNPTGGDMPNRTALCRMIGEHPAAMVDPGEARSSCDGGVGVPPSVWVSGRSDGHPVRVRARVSCDWPGGEGALAYWAAADMPHFLPVAAVRLHCDDDAHLQKAPIRWARVRACVRKIPPHWRPSTG